ncbi:MAG TPA: aminoacyl-tRNA hydrolase [Holosporales bacterium]|nr:aminoacyl-tRNA hydrolase [Holosporales bacterium]
MYLLVGLGNPGNQYLLNRHNFGFMMMDALRQHYNFPDYKEKFSGVISQGKIDDKVCILLKPTTYMNLSGHSVHAAMHFYKIAIENVYVFHDDLDIEPFKIKFKKGGGSGGHNGLKSIDQQCGKEYWRIRLGIGHPGDKYLVSPYVLSNFSEDEMKEIPFVLNALVENVPNILKNT